MDERLKFVGEYLKQERSLSELCREFSISRKTGYKFIGRYLDEGFSGLYDRSCAPHHSVHAVSDEIVTAIMALREAHPRWGARKLRAWLVRHRVRTNWPSISTIGRILARHGATLPRRRTRRCPPYASPFTLATRPNSLWCADFKGWFRTGDGKRCEPLTITDSYSRSLLVCRALPNTTFGLVRPVFEATFRRYGLPGAIRTDNGGPFASVALGGLSRLAVWWIKLGVIPERIDPGCPQQNGRHERMHRTLKEEAATPPKGSLPDQQIAFDRFRREFNRERPHEALEDSTPASVYVPSSHPYPSRMPEIAYPDHMLVRKVRPCGSIWWQSRELYVSETLVGEPVGLEQINEESYQMYYGPVKLAVLDDRNKKIIRPPIKRKKQT